MTSPTNELQLAGVAALLADEAFVALSGVTPDGPAVFAGRQSFEDVYPRTTFGPPQRVSKGRSCGAAADIHWTLHHWAKGADSSLVAAALSDAAIEALKPKLVLNGWRVSSHTHITARAVGDPDPKIEHVVSEYRFTVHEIL